MRTDAVEIVLSVPKMFGYYYDDADQVLANPNGRVVIADGRNHLELVDERFDIILTDPPPPIQSSGVSVISSLEYYEAGRDHLTDGGVMMQWTLYGTTESDLKEHIRTFAAVFPHVIAVRGSGGYGFYMLGSAEPMTLDPEAARSVLARPGVLEDIRYVRLTRVDGRRLAGGDRSSDLARRRGGAGVRGERADDHRRPATLRVFPPARVEHRAR